MAIKFDPAALNFGSVSSPAPTATVYPLRNRSIGALLVEAGRLSPADAERIMDAQRERGLRFGEAAIELGLLTSEDIGFALERQFSHATLAVGNTAVSPEVIAAFHAGHSTIEALRQLRTQLLLRWIDSQPEHRCLALVGAEAKAGTSFIAANLAVLFAQLGEKTLLIDANLRDPRQHELFRIGNSTGLTTVLSERASLDACKGIDQLPNLSVMPSGPTPPNPQELLSRPAFSRLVLAASQLFDVVLIDSAPWSAGADAQAIAVRAGASVLVTRQDHTPIRSISGIVASLRDCASPLIGSVVNRY